MKIAALVFDDLTALDLFGPLEVLGGLPNAEFVFVTPDESITAERTGIKIDVTAALDEVDSADILLVPGGQGTRRLIKHEPTLEWVRKIDQTTTWTTSVCTGSLVLAAAGLLNGRPATTHWMAYDLLEKLGAQPTSERVVFSDKYVTAAGVSSGIDMALRLAQEIYGDDLAQSIQLFIEYDPQPPFDSGSPEKADPDIVRLVRAAQVARTRSK
ncbi:MAG: DJ-1/PfpI family protein [Thermoleophilaceae bacterium]|nr:DJ-1/PfpI family protein [Thermoleophilaceae bacterium]